MSKKKKNREKFTLPDEEPNFIGTDLQLADLPKPEEYDAEININEIELSPHQTRNINLDNTDIIELANNIASLGLINPITVRPHPNQENSEYKWLLVAGERRLSAFKRLGKENIRARIRENLKDDELTAWSVTVSENIIRKQLRPDEAGLAIDEARNNFNLTHQEIAEKIGVSKARVSQLHGTAKLPDDLIHQLDKNGKLTKRHIDAFKLLIKNVHIDNMEAQDEDTPEELQSKKQIKNLLKKIVKEDLSGEDAISYAKDTVNPHKVKSFLTSINQKLPYLIKRRPAKMSATKRELIINQAKNMIDLLQKLVGEEEEKKLAEKNN